MQYIQMGVMCGVSIFHVLTLLEHLRRLVVNEAGEANGVEPWKQQGRDCGILQNLYDPYYTHKDMIHPGIMSETEVEMDLGTEIEMGRWKDEPEESVEVLPA
jgi:hypothetical protein